MSLFNDGTLDENFAKAYVKAIVSELMRRDKEYLAEKLAIMVVNQEIKEHIDEFIQQKQSELEAAKDKMDSLKDGLLDVWEGRRRDWLIGVKTIHAQAKRRRDKPATDPFMDEDRNARIRKYHSRLLKTGGDGPTKTTAEEFDLSERQIRRIVK